MIEKDVVGGAAHLWDCIPSKAMIATGGALSMINQSRGMGLTDVSASLDFDALRDRIQGIQKRLERSSTGLLESQGVRMVHGTGRLVGPHQVVADTLDGVVELDADVDPALHRQSAPHPRVGRRRRQAGSHHPRRLPAT